MIRFPSPPSWWSGLKCPPAPHTWRIPAVSTLVVEWIEIVDDELFKKIEDVSTLVVEWIEILT